MTGKKEVYAQTNAAISSSTVTGAYQVMREIAARQHDARTLALRAQLIAALVKIADELGGVTTWDMLGLADYLASYAIQDQVEPTHPEAVPSELSREELTHQWVLAQAIRSKLLPVPSEAQALAHIASKGAKPS